MAGVRNLVSEEKLMTWVKTSVWCVLVDVQLWAWAEARYCVHADVVVVDILVKLLVFHEEKPVEQFGGEIIEGSTEADDV